VDGAIIPYVKGVVVVEPTSVVLLTVLVVFISGRDAGAIRMFGIVRKLPDDDEGE